MASVYNFGYLKALVLKKLQGDAFFSEADREDALNEAQDALAIFTKADLKQALFPLTAGQDTYDWPADALAIDGINYDGCELDQMTHEEWRRGGGLSTRNTATAQAPSAYCVAGKKLILFPKPFNVTPTTYLFYIPKPDDLTDDAAVPVIARTYAEAWVALAVAKMLETDAKRLDEATYYRGLYEKLRAENSVNQNGSKVRKFRKTTPHRPAF